MKIADFLDGARRTVERHGMDVSRPLVLVSGGPDSVALLRTILDLGGRPAALHVDHGLRGEESREDAEFVRGLCAGLEVRCEVRTLDLGDGPNLQERAREERYRLARQVADELGLDTLATGHTADDVAETVLLNLSRGSGLRGLSGIPPAREGVVRPLIDRTRPEVLAYLAALDQPYRTDPTNRTTKYARNRVRLEVLPVLEDLHPGAARNLARAASLAREDLDALEALAATALEERDEEISLPRRKLLALPPALRRHAVRLAHARLLPDAPPPGSAPVEAALALMGEGAGARRLDLPGGVVAVARGGEELALYLPSDAPGGEEALVPGEIRFGGWRFRVSEVERFDPGLAARPEVAFLDASGGPYVVRAAREGDIIRPLGLGGTKKVLRAMMDRKVPADVRRRTPVVVGPGGEVAWVPLGETGEPFQVDGETREMLRVEVARNPWR